MWKFFSYNIKIQTNRYGDWLVPTFQKLSKSIITEQGLYKSENNEPSFKIQKWNTVSNHFRKSSCFIETKHKTEGNISN